MQMPSLQQLCLALCLVVQTVQAMCTWLDHQTCDELCKTDNYWYGHCVGWDGTDFSCKCYEYKPPLDGERCRNKQQQCSKLCSKQGHEGGYCYPQRDTALRVNRTACDCFKRLPDNFRRKRDITRYARIPQQACFQLSPTQKCCKPINNFMVTFE